VLKIVLVVQKILASDSKTPKKKENKFTRGINVVITKP
jgi:hypothetical protein